MRRLVYFSCLFPRDNKTKVAMSSRAYSFLRGLLLFAVVAGLIGGGIYVYVEFASTSPSPSPPAAYAWQVSAWKPKEDQTAVSSSAGSRVRSSSSTGSA